MNVEVIIHYGYDHHENDLCDTLKSMSEYLVVPDSIRICVNPPQSIVSYKYAKDMICRFFPWGVEGYLQLLIENQELITDVINHSAESSKSDHYIFVNAGYKFQNNEIISELRNKPVLFSDGVDDEYNEFSCNVKLHNTLRGFGKEHSLPKKIEYILNKMEENKNAGRTIAESRSDNL